MRFTEHTPHSLRHRLALPFGALMIVPNFLFVINSHVTGVNDTLSDNGRPEKLDVLRDRSSESVRRAWKKALRKYVPYYLKEYAFYPALAGPLFWKVALGNFMAETLRSGYSAATILCGHVGGDVKSWPAGTRANGRGEWYAMQVESTNDFEVSLPLSNPLRGPRAADRAPPVPGVAAAAAAPDRAGGAGHLRKARRPLQDGLVGQDAAEGVWPRGPVVVARRAASRSSRGVAVHLVALRSQHVHHARGLPLALELFGVCHGLGVGEAASSRLLDTAVHEENRVARPRRCGRRQRERRAGGRPVARSQGNERYHGRKRLLNGHGSKLTIRRADGLTIRAGCLHFGAQEGPLGCGLPVARSHRPRCETGWPRKTLDSLGRASGVALDSFGRWWRGVLPSLPRTVRTGRPRYT